MSEAVNPISYYDSHAEGFARQASDKHVNRFEYEQNMPSLLSLCHQVSGNVLDYGCGAGNFTTMLQRDDRIVDGCDASQQLLSIARKSYPGISFYTATEIGKTDSQKTYDLIVAKLVFHYVENLEVVLANMRRALKEGGHLLFSVPHPDKTRRHFDSDVDEAAYTDEVGTFGMTLQMVHRSTTRLDTLLLDNGFRTIKTDTVTDGNIPKRLNILAVKQ